MLHSSWTEQRGDEDRAKSRRGGVGWDRYYRQEQGPFQLAELFLTAEGEGKYVATSFHDL